MNEQVILSLETYNNMLFTIKKLQDQLSTDTQEIFKINNLGSIYIELDVKGADLVNNLAKKFINTHEVDLVVAGKTVSWIQKKREVTENVTVIIPN